MKNKGVGRVLSIVLAAAMLLTAMSFSGCSQDKSSAVLSIDGAQISANMYHFWASRYKGQYISDYDDVNNTADCWSSELLSDGTTTAEYFDALTLENLKYTLVSMKLFDEYGLSVSTSEKKAIDDSISDLVKEYADGSKNMMNTVLSEYGINLKMLRQIYIDDLKSSKVYNYLYGTDGAEPITDELKEQYYQDKYVHFQMIFINNAYQYKKDSGGNYVTDDNGYYVQEDMADDVKAQKNATISKVQSLIEAGESYDTLYSTYSEFDSYSNGFYFATDDSTLGEQIYYDVIGKVQDMEVGEIQTVAGDYGTCIVKKLELDEGGWNDSQNSDFFATDVSDFTDTVGDYLFREKLSEYFDGITADDGAIAAFTVADITPSYMF